MAIKHRTSLVLLICVATLMSATKRGHAANIQWQTPGPNPGNFGDGFNWSAGVPPGSGDHAVITNGGVVVINDGATYAISNLWVAARNAPDRIGTVQIVNGTLLINGGNPASGSANNQPQVGCYGANSVGRIEVAGGILERGVGDNIYFGGGGAQGYLTVSSGAVFVNNLRVGSDNNSGATGTGYLDVSGGLVVITNQWTVGRDNDVGIVNITGGVVSNLAVNALNGTAADNLLTVGGTPGNGTISTGIFTVTVGGTLNALGGIRIAESTAGTISDGTLRVYGGTVIAQRLFQGNIIGTSRPKVEFDGGLLQAVYGTNANGFMYGALDVRLKAGGITIDSAGYTLPVFPAFLADAGSPGGGVTKSGPGDLRLLGANTYTGPSVVNNGALILSTASTGDGAATAHDGTGFGAALAAAGSTLHLSSLILGDNAGATNEYELGVFGNPTTPVIQAASLAVNGTIYVNIHGGGLSLGRFTLIQFGSKTGTGAFLLNTLPPGIGAELAVDADSVDLLITTAPSLRWVGPGINNNWNTNSTELAWYDDLASTFKSFTDGMPVLFNDNAANGVVNISAAVAPASVTMTNASLAYTFNGPGNIIGAAFLSKFGAGTLLMATSNDYSGHTTIGAGTFRLGTNNVIPSGAGRGNVTLDGTLDLAGFNDRLNGLSGSGIIDNSAAGAVLLVIGDNVSGGTFSGLFTNSGGALTLNKVGGGTLTLAGPVRITGGITNSGGNLIISHTNDYRGGNLCHRRFLAGWQ